MPLSFYLKSNITQTLNFAGNVPEFAAELILRTFSASFPSE